jgi:GNAT superfamily N-acetyltransferase
MILEERRGDLLLSTDPSRLDVSVIHAFLSRSYWAQGIPREVVELSIEHSVCFGLYRRDDQIGFARAVTDRSTFAYLADVFILEPHRGRGLSKWLLSFVLSHPGLQNLRRFLLVTRDAHGLYEQFGFRPLENPERYAEIVRPEIYKTIR